MSAKKKQVPFSEEWAAYLQTCKEEFDERWRHDEKSTMRQSDFTVIQIISKSPFSTIKLAKHKDTLYAMKFIKKSRLVKDHHINNERKVLQSVQFPFVINMAFYFSDAKWTVFVLPYLSGGDMWQHLKRMDRLTERDSRFYSSQIVLALEYLHYMKVVYRDLKPENIAIGADGYIKLVDLGFCKRIDGRTYTYCGTTEFIAPEVLLSKGHSFPADWWSFGVVLYEMNAGFTPFNAKSEWRVCEKIVQCEYTMDKNFSKELKHLIRNLLKRDPTERLGSRRDGADDIKMTGWFQEVRWMDVFNKKLTPPYIP